MQQGKKVLLIDADAQANLTMALGYNRPDDIPITLSTVMQNIIDDKTLDAVEFSTMQAARLGWDSYGDTQYPAHVLRYYPYGRAFTSGGNQAIVEVALT